ncbi:hypothetical protein Cni_G09922 [Canna indica]|uniref:Uncharacterized protein n=1 Tax=Canna indica TaxID=4628 RepID=A0AAQ3K5R8_9LILI|nr:hypothetical protein Cni_G09922 [Canna indica]
MNTRRTVSSCRKMTLAKILKLLMLHSLTMVLALAWLHKHFDQQFQVLLQRFIENEPFEKGTRVEVYAHGRSSLSKLLQVPNFLVIDKKENVEYLDEPVLATDPLKIMEDSILTFHLFVKMDKKKAGGFFRAHSPRSSLQQVQASLEKVPYIMENNIVWKMTIVGTYSSA